MRDKSKKLTVINTEQKKSSVEGASSSGAAKILTGSLVPGSGGSIDFELLKTQFLSRIQADSASGVIDFLKGFKIKGDLISNVIRSIDNDKTASDISIFTAARVLLELEKLLSKIDNKYIRKDRQDETEFLVTFFEGLEAGLYTYGGQLGSKLHNDGTVEAGKLVVNGDANFKGTTKSDDFIKGESGWAIHKDTNGKWIVEADTLLARVIGDLAELYVKNQATFAGSLSSEEFVSGFESGKGWAIRQKEFINAAGEKEYRSVAEFDDVVVRGVMRVTEFIVNQLLGENDNRVFTGMAEVEYYDAGNDILYIQTRGGKLYNPFRKDDVIIVQQFGGMPSEENDYYVTKAYEFVVTEAGIGNIADGEDRLDWVKFKNFVSPMEGGTPSLIAKGDTLVRWDNLTDDRRKGIVSIHSVGEDTPYIDFLHGAKTDPDNALKGRLGNLGGIFHPLFGWLPDFGAYLSNLYAVGEFVIAHSGESVADSIKIAKGTFRTNFRQSQYDLTEESNYLKNANFLNDCEGWQLGSDTTEYFTVGDDLDMQFFNFDLLSTESSFAGIAEFNGRDMLRLNNSTAMQLNADIRKPGTHKEYSGVDANGKPTGSDVVDTLYLNVRVYCKVAGTLTIGFANNGTYIENSFRHTLTMDESVDAYTISLSGKWDGKGDFLLTGTGDIYIDLLSLTDKPLDNYKVEMQTAIEQTAQGISLVGKKVTGLNDSIVILSQTINLLDNSITTMAQEVTAQGTRLSQLSVSVDSISSAVTNVKGTADSAQSLASAAKSAADSAATAANNAQTTANSALNKATSNATAITQNSNYISLLVGAFTLKEGKYELTEAAGVAITNKVATIYATQTTVNALGDRVSSAEASIKVNANSISTKVSANGVISAINQTSETIKIDASRIELTGKVTFAMLDSNAQNTINGKATQANIDTSVNTLKNTIISGGYIITSLIDTSKLRAQIVESTNTYGKMLIEGGQIIFYDKSNNENFSVVTGMNYTLMTIGNSADKSVTIHPSDISVWTTKGANSLNDKGLTLCEGSSFKNFTLGNISSTMSNTVDFLVTSSAFSLPSASTCKGKVLFVKMLSGVKVTSSSAVYNGGDSSTWTNKTYDGARAVIYISNGTYWYEYRGYQ